MGIQPDYHVTHIAGGRMPAGHDWLYLREDPCPVLLIRVGTDERRVFREVVEMLADGAAADRLAYRVA